MNFCIRLWIPALLALLLVGCGSEKEAEPVALAAEVAEPELSNWPMVRGGPALSGRVSEKLIRSPQVEWTFKTGSPISGEPAIGAGKVFIGSDNGTCFALDAATGTELWRFKTEDSVTTAPTIGEGVVYVPSNDGRLYALDIESGEERWQFDTEDSISAGVTLHSDPESGEPWVVFNGYDGITRCLRASDGSLVWEYDTGDLINGAVAVLDNTYGVFGGCDARFHVVNLADGKPVRSVETDAQITSSVATFGNFAYCGNYANQVVAADIMAGEIKWIYEDRGLPFMSAPAANAETVFIGSRDKHLHAIDRMTGERHWKFKTGERIEGSSILFEDAVVFGSGDGRLYALNPTDGTEIWRLDLGAPVDGSPAFGLGRIVIGVGDGTVFSIGESNN